MEHLSKILCGTGEGVGEAFDVLRHVRHSVDVFGDRVDVLLTPEGINDLTLIGPFCARVIMETGCAAIVGRLDPFRLLYLSRFQSHSDYDPSKRSKSAFSWQGDVFNPEKEKEDIWNENIDLQKISRALFSSHLDHIHWRPAVLAALDSVAGSTQSAAISSITSIEADSFIAESRGRGSQLYSQLSKGVHWEFFNSIAVSFDHQTSRQLVQDAILWTTRLALMVHFVPTAQCSLLPMPFSVTPRYGTGSMVDDDDSLDATLILAAEECPPEQFEQIHKFSEADQAIIRKLIAHGPVLIRGGRGSGKSALLIEADRRMKSVDHIFSVYVSLRYLPLLQSDGDEYIGHFCTLVSKAIQDELERIKSALFFPISRDQSSFIDSIMYLSTSLERRIVLLFDDAAHIGREKPLTIFFDLFRTLSTSAVSCKASIYPGVTKFGVRFDVYNDSTVVDIARTEAGEQSTKFFSDVVAARYPRLATADVFSERMSPQIFASFVGRAVIGNMRAFVFACTQFSEKPKIDFPDIVECLLNMATNYYWPLMDEVAPKLGVYEPMIEPAQQIAEITIDNVIRAAKVGARTTPQDRVLIHRNLVNGLSKPLEILEYLGFMTKLEASRALKSGGRGPVYALNLCTLIEKIPGRRITFDDVREWTSSSREAAEIHPAGNAFAGIQLPKTSDQHDLSILDKDISVLSQSKIYPYGLTPKKIDRLKGAGFLSVGQLASASDQILDEVETIGPAMIARIKNVVSQAIWM